MWVGSLLTGAEYPLLPRDRMAHWIMFQRLPVIFYLVLATVRDRRQMAVLLLCMAFSYLMLSRGTRGAVAGRDISFYRQNLRVEGALGQPNMLGAMMAQCAAYCLGFFGVARGKALKVLVFAAFLVGCVVVMFTYSRGAYVALAAGVLYLTMLRMPYLLLLLIPMGAAWQVWLPGAVAERISMTYDDQGELEGSSAKRFELWNFAWNLIKSQPVLGVGFDTFRYFRADEELQDTHNLYIRVQVETGILGLAVLGWLFLKSYLTGFRLYRKGKDPFLRAIGLGFSAYMVALVMANMFGDRWTYIALSGYTFTLLALTVRAQEMENGEAVAAVPQETAPPFAPGIQTGFVGGRSANLPR
jgi:O-antigen ligase